MRNSKYSTVMIGGEDYSQYFKFPFVVQKTLDESLDFAVIELHHLSFKTPFKPFTPVTLGDDTGLLSFIVASDEVEEIFGTGRYKHTVTVMEQTKETERIMCGAKAFTNPLVRDYTDGQTKSSYLFMPKIGNFDWFEYPVPDDGFTSFYVNDNTYVSPVLAGSLNTFSLSSSINFDNHASIFPGTDLTKADIKVYYNAKESALAYEMTDKTNKIIRFYPKQDSLLVYSEDNLPIAEAPQIDYSKNGTYTIIAAIKMANGTIKYGILMDILCVDEPVKKDIYTVEDVVTHLLDTSETLRDGLDTPRYTLTYQSAEQRERFLQEAPEFRFPNGRSLWENLREIGQFVHAIPRTYHHAATNKDYIQFYDLGGADKADLSKGERYGGGTSLSVGDYTAGLEAIAANLVNLDDVSDGSITEPFDGGYQSLRATTDEARIAEKTGIIKTTHPIERIIKVEVGQITVNGKTYAGGDITPYVFPRNEYDILSNYTGMYPTSKTYAIYYTQGAPNIEGLWYKAQDSAADILNAFEKYSITNIILAALGTPTGIMRDLNYQDLMFRVTYIPSVTARVRQYNPVYDGTFPAMLAHNQSANKLSAKAFGENLRGQLAMMSKADETVRYRFRRLDDIPEPGTLYDDDRYISSITARVYHDFVLAQLNLSAGYNELGARVEINNAIRQFEIPTSEDRYTTLEEFVVVGKQEDDDPNLAMTVDLQYSILGAFRNQDEVSDVSLALVTTKDDKGDVITSTNIALPVVSLAIGTSLYFGFRFENNFAAGSQSNVGGTGFRSQDYVKYGDDFYSHAKTIGFKLVYDAGTSTPLDTAHALPSGHGVSGSVAVDTGDYPILWHKDSADAGCLAYQVHYMTNDDLIIGDGIAYACPAVRKNPISGPARVYFFPHRINQLTGITNTETAINADRFGFKGEEVVVSGNHIHGVTAPPEAVSWAIIKGGRFMIGKNSKTFNDIYFNFKRRMKS